MIVRVQVPMVLAVKIAPCALAVVLPSIPFCAFAESLHKERQSEHTFLRIAPDAQLRSVNPKLQNAHGIDPGKGNNSTKHLFRSAVLREEDDGLESRCMEDYLEILDMPCQAPAPQPATPRDFSVDVVYTWIKQPSLAGFEKMLKDCPHLTGGWQRVRNMHTFRFSLQMLGLYLPWVRKVFIVTPGEVPDWLNTSNPKVEVIKQETLWPQARLQRDLPIHNSQQVEAYLHRIPNLMPHFVYFNDDMFVGRPLPRSFFFTDKGAPVVHQTSSPEMNWCNLKEPRALRMDRFTHTYTSLTIPMIQAVQKRWPAFFDKVSSAHCRGDLDVLQGPTWAYAWYGVHSGLTSQSNMTDCRMSWMRDQTKNRTAWYQEQLLYPPDVGCINDDFSMNESVYRAETNELAAFMHTFSKEARNPLTNSMTSPFIKAGHYSL